MATQGDLSHVVAWCDRWLGCQIKGAKGFTRRWVALDGTTLQVWFAPDDVSGPLLELDIRELQVEENTDSCEIDVETDATWCVFRCGEQIEFEATAEALKHHVDIAKSECPRCPQLQEQIGALLQHVAALKEEHSSLEAADEEAASAQRVSAQALAAAQAKTDAAEATALRLQQHVDELEERLQVTARRATSAESGERKALCETKELKAALSNLQSTTRDTDSQVANLTQREQQAQQQAEAANAKAAEAAAENAGRMRRQTQLESEVAQLRAEIEFAASRTGTDAAHIDALTARAAAADDRSAGLQDQLVSATTAAAKHEHDAQAARRELADTQREAVELRAQLHSQLADARSAVEQGQRRSEAAVAELQRTLAEVDNARVEAVARGRQVELELSAARGKADAAVARLAMVEQEIIPLRSAAAKAAARTYRNTGSATNSTDTKGAACGTIPFAEAFVHSPEAAELSLRAAQASAAEVAGDLAAIVAHQMGSSGVVDAEAILASLRPYIDSSFVGLFRRSRSTSGDRSASLGPGLQEGSAVSEAHVRTLRQRATGAVDDAERRLLDTKQSLEKQDGTHARAMRVAEAKGFLGCLADFDPCSGALASNTKFRTAVQGWLKGPGADARAAATTLLSGPKSQCPPPVEVACRALTADYCATYDRLIQCAGKNVLADSDWVRSVEQTTRQCRVAVNRVRTFVSSPVDSSALDGVAGEAAVIAEHIRRLLKADPSAHHAMPMHELVTAHAELQAALFMAVRQRNRGWLRHHLAAESIARFGVALKRAGQVLDQSRIRGAEPTAGECLAAWPIVKQLTELPRLMIEEDRAFSVLWHSMQHTSQGMFVLPEAAVVP